MADSIKQTRKRGVRAEESNAFARVVAAASRLLSGASCQRASIVARIEVVS